MKKIKIITIIIIITSLLLMGVGLIIFKSSSGDSKEKTKLSKKGVVDSYYCNIEETLRDTHVYDEYLNIIGMTIREIGPYYELHFTAINGGYENVEHQHLKFIMLSNTKKKIGEVECKIPELKSREKAVVTCQSTNKKIFNAFDFKITSINEKSK